MINPAPTKAFCAESECDTKSVLHCAAFSTLESCHDFMRHSTFETVSACPPIFYRAQSLNRAHARVRPYNAAASAMTNFFQFRW